MTDTHEILCEAVQRIARQGWHQGSYFETNIWDPHENKMIYNYDSALCLTAACVEFDHGDVVAPIEDSPRDIAIRAVNDAIPGYPEYSNLLRRMVVWNDSPTRSVEDVFDVLGSAIADESDDD